MYNVTISYKLNDNYVELWANDDFTFSEKHIFSVVKELPETDESKRKAQKELDEKLKHFNDNYYDYKQTANGLVYDESHNGLDKLKHERTLHNLRESRSQKCFIVINRGQVWYNTLTDEQRQELQEWYQAWLDATYTLVEPETPEWLLSPKEQDSEHV